MSFDFERPDAEEKATHWDELQSQIGPSDVNFDDQQIRRTAGGPMEQAVRSITDSFWAGSATINEEFELSRHVKEMVDEGRVYPVIEKSLIAYGYTKDKIRRVFQKMTNIDPVQAYLDTATYTIPPDAVPRYNYGWGISKDSKADYFYVLPFISKFAIYKQTGLEREIVFDHLSLEVTRDELKKLVKDVRAVTPDSLDTHSDIIQRVASVNVPAFETEEAQKIAAEVSRLKQLDSPELAKKLVLNAEQEGLLSKAELTSMLQYVEAEDPSDMSATDREHNSQVEKYQKDQEGRTIQDEITSLKIPQDDFRRKLEDESKVNMKELTNDAFELLEDISQTIPGYDLEAEGQSIDLVDVQAYSPDESNHIDTGSIRFLVKITDLKNQAERRGLVVMFIVNGKLTYSGKFKGEDNREYALSSPGVNAYFDNADANSVEDITHVTQNIPESEVPMPYR